MTQESFLCFICNIYNALYDLPDLASPGSLVKTIHVETMPLNGMKEFSKDFTIDNKCLCHILEELLWDIKSKVLKKKKRKEKKKKKKNF